MPFLALLASGPAAAADLALGEYLAGECATCHQRSNNTNGGIPSLAGLPEFAFKESITAYKIGKRDNAVMRNIASRLSEEELDALAAYFAAQRR